MMNDEAEGRGEHAFDGQTFATSAFIIHHSNFLSPP